MTTPVPLASGRDADVFAIDARCVLRRYRDGADATAEADLMAYVRERGYPVPAVYEVNHADLVMERLDGPTMVGALVAGQIGAQAGGEMLADLHRRLHEIPARESSAPDLRIVHLDLHPDNIVLTARGPVVIDWRNAREGSPDLDLALSAVILAQVAVDDTSELAEPAKLLLDSLLANCDGEPWRMLTQALAIRAANPTMTPDEISRLPRAAALLRAAC